MASACDFAVIGGGNAGVAAAKVAREAGKSVVLFERRELGGTCALRGCVPKKVLVAAAEVLDTIARAGQHGIRVGEPKLDWGKLIARKETFVEGVPDDFAKMLTKRGVRVVLGDVRFTSAHELEAGGERFRADKIVVAAGSIPRPLPIDGAEKLATSDDVLSLAELPQSVAFIGAGVVAMELAHVLVRAGARVTLLEAAPRPLSNFDADLVDALLGETRRLGIDVQCDVEVRRIESGAIVYAREGKEHTLQVDLAVNGAGRVPALADLALERAGVELDQHKPKIDRYLRSISNPDVLFAGDAFPGSPQLSPLATYEGAIAGKNALATEDLVAPDYTPVPSVVFTIPALAQVGLDEKTARERGFRFETKTNDLVDWRSARTYAETVSRSKVLIDESGRILGAHLLGHGAQETIHAFAFHMRHGLPASALAESIAAYPTFHSDLKHML